MPLALGIGQGDPLTPLQRAGADAGTGVDAEATTPPPADTPVRIPLTGMRRAIADKLSTSRREIPDATTWVDVDATGLMDARAAFKAAGRDEITLLALLARFSVAALHRFPELNASVDPARGEIVRHPRIHLGFAAQSPRGLVVPVVRDADAMTTSQLGHALAELTAENHALREAAGRSRRVFAAGRSGEVVALRAGTRPEARGGSTALALWRPAGWPFPD